jgi:hypothetical protein
LKDFNLSLISESLGFGKKPSVDVRVIASYEVENKALI